MLLFLDDGHGAQQSVHTVSLSVNAAAFSRGALLPKDDATTAERRRLHALVGQSVECYAPDMTITARVHAGRLVLDEPTTLPEGTQVALLPLDPGDWLDDTDRAALHGALQASDADVAAGRLVDAAEVLLGLRTP